MARTWGIPNDTLSILVDDTLSRSFQKIMGQRNYIEPTRGLLLQVSTRALPLKGQVQRCLAYLFILCAFNF